MGKFTLKTLFKGLWAAVTGCWILVILVNLAMAPWGPALGIADSPTRWLLAYFNTIVGLLATGAVCMWWFKLHPEYIARPGRYQPGRSYAVITPYSLSAMGVVAALYATLGIAFSVGADLGAVVTAFSATFFGPIITFVAVFAGAFVRFFLGGTPWLTAFSLPQFAIWDGSVWAINAAIYWKIVRAEPLKRVSWSKWVLAIIIMVVIHWTALHIVEAIARYPIEGVLAKMVTTAATWYPTTVASIIFGVLAGEAVYRMSIAPVSK